MNKTVTRTALSTSGRIVTNQAVKRIVSTTPSLAKTLGRDFDNMPIINVIMIKIIIIEVNAKAAFHKVLSFTSNFQ